jgi:hypothetical protein
MTWLEALKIYAKVNRNIQALSSVQLVEGTEGYTPHGAAVIVPPHNYTYSDTGMFEDTDGAYLFGLEFEVLQELY